MAENGSPEFERLIAEGQARAAAESAGRPEEGSAEAAQQRRESIDQGKSDGSGGRVEHDAPVAKKEAAELAGPVAARKAFEDARFRKHSVNAEDDAEEETDPEREARVEAAKKAAEKGRPAAESALIQGRRRGANKPERRQLRLF